MVTFLYLFAFQSQPSLDILNGYLKNRNISALQKLSAGDGKEFRVLAGGAYSVGQFGWKAVPLGDRHVVFTTPLTSEDIGELLFERVGEKLKYIPETQFDGLRLKNHNLKVKFTISKKEVDIQNEVDIEVKTSTSSFHVLRFSPCYQVSSLTDGKESIPFQQAGGIVMIPKRQTGKGKLNLTYKGKVDLPQYAGSITPNIASLTNDYWYPMCNRMPATYSITVYPPASDWKVVAQGDYLGKTTGEKEVGERYRMNLPAIYWSLTVGKLKYQSQNIDKRKFEVWSRNMSERGMKMQIALNAPILDYYETSFSRYPFTSWGSLDSPTYGGGALEAYSYATYGEGWLPDEDPHEPAHTWFGGILPNTYLKSFWNESFAVWCEGFYAREVGIGNTNERRQAFADFARPQKAYDEASLMESGVDIGAAAGALGYGKGGHVLSMLENLVGTKNLVETIQQWIREHPVGEPAEWEDFEKHCYRRMPQFNLKDFFDDWFRRPGVADVSLKNVKFSKGRLSGQITFAGPKFRMPLEIWLENKIGGRQRLFLDTQICDENGNFDVSTSNFTPNKVYLDPFLKSLRRDPKITEPKSFEAITRSYKVFRDSRQRDMCEVFTSNTEKLPEDLSKTIIIGHPDTTPALKELCAKAGFAVNGEILTYKGTTINLKQAAAFAVVSLADGKQCAIGIGTCERVPKLGRATTGLVEKYGRFLRGETPFPTVPAILVNQ